VPGPQARPPALLPLAKRPCPQRRRAPRVSTQRAPRRPRRGPDVRLPILGGRSAPGRVANEPADGVEAVIAGRDPLVGAAPATWEGQEGRPAGVRRSRAAAVSRRRPEPGLAHGYHGA